MSFCLIHLATITVADYKNLLPTWRIHGDLLVGKYIIEQPPTDAQLCRLPKRLRDILVIGKESEQGSLEWLERLYELEDHRGE